ncbi:UNVERIFIED_CONTAM: hypothetical protein GTU68_010136 [Idotea baltica]|nr:hypothetical protein [Idotea baltica]
MAWLHVHATFNNTTVNDQPTPKATRFAACCGTSGFKASRKSTPFARSMCGSTGC